LAEIRFGIVGLGLMGQRRIAALRMIQDVKIIAVCDTDSDKTKTTAAMTQCAGFTNYKDMLEISDLDCVVVSVPNTLHYEITASLLRAGKNVMCEKPLATTPEQAWDIVRIAKKQKVFLKTASNHRYMPNILKAHEIVTSGGIGKPLFFRGFIGHAGQRFSSKWFLDQQMSGGGTLMDNGCHLLDLSRWFLGDIIECKGYVDTMHLQIAPLEDNAFALLRMKNNTYAMISSSWTEWFGYLYFEIYGDQGFVIADCRYGNRVRHGRTNDDHVKAYDFSDLPPQSYQLEMTDLVARLSAHEQPLPSGEDGAKVVDVIHAIYRSSKTGMSIQLRPEDQVD